MGMNEKLSDSGVKVSPPLNQVNTYIYQFNSSCDWGGAREGGRMPDGKEISSQGNKNILTTKWTMTRCGASRDTPSWIA